MLNEASLLGKWGFVADLIQLVIGSTIGLIILGVVFALFIIVYIIGKVLNVQEARENAAEPDDEEPSKVELKKNP